MSFIRAIFRRIGRLFAITFALVAIGYIVLLVINWRDQPLSADTLSFAELIENRPTVADEDNAFVYMLGFAANPQADPMQVGRERKAWIVNAVSKRQSLSEPLARDGDFNFSADRSDTIKDLKSSCSSYGTECVAAYRTSEDSIRDWLRTRSWILDRYTQLLERDEFLEVILSTDGVPNLRYEGLLAGQDMYFARLWFAADDRELNDVREGLNRDLIFWRMVLENSDTLITKMVATSAIQRHFKMGNLIIRRLPAESLAAAVPNAWHDPISKDERSMRRSWAGEWLYGKNIIDEFSENGMLEGETVSSTGISIWSGLLWKILSPALWQRQDILNRQAAYFAAMIEAFDVPYSQLDEALSTAAEIDRAHNEQQRLRAYNLIGQFFPGSSGSNSRYPAHVADLEGTRRAALLASKLRAAGVDSAAAAAAVAAAEIRNPYTDAAFGWDREQQAIVFEGLNDLQSGGPHSLVF